MDQQRSKTPVEQVIETVSSWPNVVTGEGRFNSTAFQVGLREIGHIHSGGAVDIGYPKRLRDQLIEEGRTGEHHVVSNLTATTFSIDSADDINNAVWLLRLSYLHHVLGLQQRGGTDPKLADIDVEEELDDLDPSDALRSTVETTAGH